MKWIFILVLDLFALCHTLMKKIKYFHMKALLAKHLRDLHYLIRILEV